MVKILPEIEYFIKTQNGKSLLKDEECTKEHRECSPLIKSKQTSMNINNQMIFNLKHCYCDINLFNCLKRSKDPNSKRIGDIYFNLFRVKCFRYEYRPQCNLYLFGTCILTGNLKCFAKTQQSPKF